MCLLVEGAYTVPHSQSPTRPKALDQLYESAGCVVATSSAMSDRVALATVSHACLRRRGAASRHVSLAQRAVAEGLVRVMRSCDAARHGVVVSARESERLLTRLAHGFGRDTAGCAPSTRSSAVRSTCATHNQQVLRWILATRGEPVRLSIRATLWSSWPRWGDLGPHGRRDVARSLQREWVARPASAIVRPAPLTPRHAKLASTPISDLAPESTRVCCARVGRAVPAGARARASAPSAAPPTPNHSSASCPSRLRSSPAQPVRRAIEPTNVGSSHRS